MTRKATGGLENFGYECGRIGFALRVNISFIDPGFVRLYVLPSQSNGSE